MARVTSICRRRPSLRLQQDSSWDLTSSSGRTPQILFRCAVFCTTTYTRFFFLPYFALKKSLYPIAFDRCFFESLFCVVSCNPTESISIDVQISIEFDSKMGSNFHLKYLVIVIIYFLMYRQNVFVSLTIIKYILQLVVAGPWLGPIKLKRTQQSRYP